MTPFVFNAICMPAMLPSSSFVIAKYLNYRMEEEQYSSVTQPFLTSLWFSIILATGSTPCSLISLMQIFTVTAGVTNGWGVKCWGLLPSLLYFKPNRLIRCAQSFLYVPGALATLQEARKRTRALKFLMRSLVFSVLNLYTSCLRAGWSYQHTTLHKQTSCHPWHHHTTWCAITAGMFPEIVFHICVAT